MQISLIAAMAHNRVIGKDNQMPWHLPEDLQHFKKMTLGKPVVMGRKTFESIGRPLPGRHNIVISRNPDYQPEGVTVVDSFEKAYQLEKDTEELMVMGGGQLYLQTLPKADNLYLTFIDLEVEGDTQFPHWDDGCWTQVWAEKHTNLDGLTYEFVKYSRAD
ncbi:type 3 dihydrofolate reductase [Paraferrimonas sp. SM1919]|uniref:type 3 dihydrofolate reductase n=1 Tax=Paraferrimonas sp. SM1919 TaxID=2662263 RepID=UPI0013D3F58B|nr:type 3 dihydrofolate reductase [Paraferrimonas sp. SM1919]